MAGASAICPGGHRPPALRPAEPPSPRGAGGQGPAGRGISPGPLPPSASPGAGPPASPPSPQHRWPGHPRPSPLLPKASPSPPRANPDSTQLTKTQSGTGGGRGGWCWIPEATGDPETRRGREQSDGSRFSESGGSAGKDSGLGTAIRAAASACTPPVTGSSPLCL